MVPICSTLLPISEASLRHSIFDFRFHTIDLARDRFALSRDSLEGFESHSYVAAISEKC